MIQKFRAWHKKEKKMYEVGGLQFTTKVRQKILDKAGEKDSNWIKLEQHSKKYGGCVDAKSTVIENIILMQSTGLKDKNGNEIFEGDILAEDKGKSHQVNRIVKWVRDGFRAECIEDIMNGDENLSITIICSEVIGNIHENKELLK